MLDIPYAFLMFTLHIPLHVFAMPIHFHLVTFPIRLSLFFHAYIRLIDHVCFCSSYINIYCQSPTHVQLKSHASGYFQPLETIRLLTFCTFDFVWARKLFPWYLSPLRLPYSPLGVHIPAYNSKYLDHNRRPAQHMSWSPCPEPLHIQNPRDLTYALGNLGLDL